MSTPQALLQLKDLRIAFGGQAVVHGVNLCIQAGERVALVGESGSGKSVTALSVLRLLESAQLSGQVLWQGQDLLKQTPPEMQRIRGDEIAMIFQEPMTSLNPVMSVGSRSGVHCTRENLPPTLWASVFAKVVLPVPGRSSSSRCPLARRQASTNSIA